MEGIGRRCISLTIRSSAVLTFARSSSLERNGWSAERLNWRAENEHDKRSTRGWTATPEKAAGCKCQPGSSRWGRETFCIFHVKQNESDVDDDDQIKEVPQRKVWVPSTSACLTAALLVGCTAS